MTHFPQDEIVLHQGGLIQGNTIRGSGRNEIEFKSWVGQELTSLRRIVSYNIMIDEGQLKRMVAKALKNKNRRTVDGPIEVHVTESIEPSDGAANP